MCPHAVIKGVDMTQFKSKDRFGRLLEQAESIRLGGKYVQTSSGPSDLLKLIQELQSLRVELELQNEGLHRSQQELMRSKMRYTQLFDHAPVGYITTSSKGLILNVNKTFADLLGIDKNSLINKRLSAYIIHDDLEIYHRHVSGLSGLKTRQDCELRLQKRDGTFVDVRLESNLISQKHVDPLQYRTVIIDISEQKKTLKAEQEKERRMRHSRKMKSVRKIVGGFSHNFNNILHIIMGNVELARRKTPKDGAALANLKTIETTDIRAAESVRTLLSFSDKTDREQHPLDVVMLVKETVERLRQSIPETIEIVDFFPDAEVFVLGDHMQIRQMIMNLGANASRAMERRGGILEIKIQSLMIREAETINYPDLKAGEYAKITVRDTGSGIDPDISDQIFDPYFTTKKTGKAAGLGLTVVYGIVKNHDGAIFFKTKKDVGTKFSILLPILKKAPADNAKPCDDQNGESDDILWADDYGKEKMS